MIKHIDYLLTKIESNTINHVYLENCRDMIIHGNYKYATEILSNCDTLTNDADFCKLLEILNKKITNIDFYNANDPIQARIIENYNTIKNSKKIKSVIN